MKRPSGERARLLISAFSQPRYLQQISSPKLNNQGPGRFPVYEILTKFCSHDYHFIFLDFIYYVGNGFTYKQQKNFF
nr:MAG TPA: hypothetical protein [Caudoviricetes sp.]